MSHDEHDWQGDEVYGCNACHMVMGYEYSAVGPIGHGYAFFGTDGKFREVHHSWHSWLDDNCPGKDADLDKYDKEKV